MGPVGGTPWRSASAIGPTWVPSSGSPDRFRSAQDCHGAAEAIGLEPPGWIRPPHGPDNLPPGVPGGSVISPVGTHLVRVLR